MGSASAVLTVHGIARDLPSSAKAQFLPKRTYKDKLSVGSGKSRVDLYYFGAGHTNGGELVARRSNWNGSVPIGTDF